MCLPSTSGDKITNLKCIDFGDENASAVFPMDSTIAEREFSSGNIISDVRAPQMKNKDELVSTNMDIDSFDELLDAFGINGGPVGSDDLFNINSIIESENFDLTQLD